MPRIFRHIAQRMMILFLLLGGMGLVCQEAQAAPAARAMWDANTKTLTFYYGEQKSGGTTHWSGTQITATGTSYPKWHTSDVYSNVTNVVFESSFANVRPASCLGWFYGMEKLTTISGINYLKTDNVTSMYCMFYGCGGLTSLNLSSFNTANVTNMAYMFYGCSGLTSLNLSSFNTAKVTNMYSMFYGCSGLTSLNLSSFNTANVTNMAYMFGGCHGLTSLNLSSFNTAKVTNIVAMFSGCSGLTSLNLSSFNTANVTNMAEMFYGCSGLTSLNLSSFNTANVTSMWRMFTNCSSLTSLDLRSFNTAKVTDMEAMFKGCSNLQIIYVDESKWSTAAVTSSTDMFYGCTKLIGGNGTVFNSSYTNRTRACIDKPGQVGYLTCATEYGTCGANGDNLTWLLSCDGTLTIRGTGAMYNWMSLADRPWHSLCTSIQRVFIEEGVTTTGYHAFYGASNLTSVSLPSTLQTLQFMTFFGCGKLTTLTIPSSVTYVGSRSLEGCSSLTDVYMSETGDAIPTMPAGIHTYDASRITLHIPCGQAGAYFAKGWNTKFTLPDVVSGTCGDNVRWTFESCNGTLSIFGTGAIDDYTNTNQIPWYSYRSSIIGVSISNGITRIGKATCYNCFNLTSVSMGTGVTSIGTSAFYGCSKLPSITIGNHVTTIEQSAFYNCSALKSITIPPSVTSIGTNAFMGCWAMESVYITDLAAWCHINFSSYTSSPFYRNTRNDVAHGGGNLYVNGTKVTTLRIPDGITEIPHRAFFGFMGITSIQFNQVTTIGNHAFGACHGLTSLTFPEGVTAINYNTFGYCTQLQTIYLPASLTTFGDYVWWNCDALTDIYVSWTENIPSLSTSITDKYPQSDITLHVPCGTAALYQAAEDWQDYTIVEERGHGTCGAQGDNLTWSLSCDGTLTISGSGAMADWSSSDKVPWYSYRSSITTVNIRDGVTSVGNRAFIDCAVLTSVTIPNSVTSISNNAFFSCSALTGIAIPNSVTTIGQYVFYGCSALTNITIPNSVTSLRESIFRNCSALTDIYVSWIGTDILELPTNIHNSASEIKLHIPCGTAADYASKNWSTMFTLNEGSASGTCGANGDNLTWSLSCGGTLTISGTGEMYNWMSLADRPWHSLCTSIQRVVIEEGVTTTGFHAFYGASNLTSVSLPSTLQTLQFMTFFGCGKLTTLTIPSSVTYVGSRSLEGCSALTDVYMSETGDAVPTMPPGIHTYDASRITLHIPCGQAGAYFAKGWNTKFTFEQENTHYTITVESDDPSMGTVDAVKIGE